MSGTGPSASQAGLYDLCSRPMAVEPVAEPAPNVEGLFGSAGHWIMSQVINNPPAEWISGPAQFIDKALKLHGLDPEEYRNAMIELRPIRVAQDLFLAHPTCEAEVAYALDPYALDEEGMRSKLLGKGIDRQYAEHGAPADWVKGTVDVQWCEAANDMHPNTLVLREWKFGSPDNVDEVEENLQLLTLSELAWDLYPDCELCRVELAFVLPGQLPVITSRTIAREERELNRAQVLGIWEKQVDITPTPGPHCWQRWCPLRGECSVAEQALAELIAENPPVLGPNDPPIDTSSPLAVSVAAIQDPEVAEKVYARLRHAKGVVETTEEALRQRATLHGDIKAGGGRIWGPRGNTRESIRASSQLELQAALKDALPSIAYEAACKRMEVSLTKEALFDVCGSEELFKKTCTLLRKRSLMAMSYSTSFREEDANKARYKKGAP